jgi:hypothetical protein
MALTYSCLTESLGDLGTISWPREFLGPKNPTLWRKDTGISIYVMAENSRREEQVDDDIHSIGC